MSALVESAVRTQLRRDASPTLLAIVSGLPIPQSDRSLEEQLLNR